MISEVNLVGSNNSGWWVDTGSTRHVCADKSMFHSIRAVDNGEKLYMCNSTTVDIKSEGDVILKMTSGKELKLTNPDKFVLSKNQMYVGKGYALNGHMGEPILTDTYLLNKIHCKENEETPCELWIERKPSYQYLRVWGCLAKEIGSSSRMDDIVVQDKRQRDDNDLQDERQDQAEEAEVEPRIRKRLGRYTNNPSDAHWKAMIMIFDIKDSRSTSEYVFPLGGAAISWKSSKQTVIAKSTMESKFIVLDKCRKVAEWLHQLVEDIPRWPKPVTAISIHCDSKLAIGRAHSIMYNGKSRHIRCPHNSIRRLLSTGVISTDYMKSKDNIADPLIKGLSRELVIDWRSQDLDSIGQPNYKNVGEATSMLRMTNTMVTTPMNVTGAPVTNTIANHVEPPREGKPSNAQAMQPVEAWKHSDFLCRNYVLNGLVDSLYNVYCKTTTAKELLESLKHKYKTQDVSTKKFMVAHFLDYKMVDSKNVISQDNMVEQVGSSSKSNSKAKGKGKGKGKRKNDNKSKGKAKYLAPKAGIMKHKFQGTCYDCDQPSRCAANCKMSKRVTPRHANMVNDNMDMISMVSDVIAMISKVNLVGSNNSGWWVDTGATHHMCADKSMFYSFRAIDNGEKLYKGNSTTTNIKGIRDVIFKMTSKKELKLTNVFKDEAIDKFVLYKIKVENQLGHVGEDILTTTYLLNKTPRKEKEETPYELWMGRKPSYQYLRVWGVSSQDERQDQPEEVEVEPRRSKRARTEKSFGPDFVSFMVENESTSYQESVNSLEGPRWKESIKSEIDYILQNHNWELVDLRPGCKPLGYKWIFKKKMKADGTIDKYKARLKFGSSPNGCNNGILNKDLEEEIYMNQPEGFIAPGQESKVCRLVKSLYGLKQAPKKWHQKFDHTMLESVFKVNGCDTCVYVKDTNSGYVILCLYVDDMLIIGSNKNMINSTKDMLKSKFDMKDMGLADVILGIQIIQNHNGLVLSSRDYGLHYDRYLAVIEGYSDASWISDIKDSRYTSGYVFSLGEANISWKSSIQTVKAKSTMKS
ncbi:retrovirus-related pol polyprotein from transposon TNT 1-94 [Tanacetum coccineum]